MPPWSSWQRVGLTTAWKHYRADQKDLEYQRMNKAKGQCSEVMLSSLYCMGITSRIDPRRAIPSGPKLPDEDTRRFWASLIWEEALETIHALGMDVVVGPWIICPGRKDVRFTSARPPDLEQIIDGCCDVEYVTKGTLAACGVPDLPHLRAVCEANSAKFPGGVAKVREDGKFLKPEGWTAPNHTAVMLSARMNDQVADLHALSEQIITERTV
jgi:hypothetical protein